MKIYMLTPLGKKLARSTMNPDTEGWRIVHFLDKTGSATTDQIADGARAPGAAGTLAILSRRNPPIVKEAGDMTTNF